VSCITALIPELAKATPVNPPRVKRNKKPKAKSIGVSKVMEPPHIVAIQLNILIPVGTAIIIVAAVK
jgi:hypothetical protein